MTDFALGSAVVALKAEFGQFRDDLDKAKRETSQASDRMSRALKAVGTAAKGIAVVGAAAGAAAVGLGALVTRAVNAAEAIQDTADRVGVSAERLQELRFAFTQTGASAGDVDRALLRLNSSLGEFVRSGAGPAKEGLRLIGITSREATAALGNTEQAFDEIVRRIAEIEDPAQRAGVAARLFGEEAGPKLAVLIGQGEGAVDDLAQKARDMGIVLENDAVRAAAAASAQLRAMAEVISTQTTRALIELAPQITAIAERFANSLPTIIAWVEALGRFTGFLDAPLEEQLGNVTDQIDALNERLARNPPDWLANQMRERLVELQAEAATLRDRLDQLAEMRERLNDPVEVAPVSVPDLPDTGSTRERPEPYTDLMIEMRQAQQARMEEIRQNEMSTNAARERARVMGFEAQQRRLTSAALQQYLGLTQREIDLAYEQRNIAELIIQLEDDVRNEIYATVQARQTAIEALEQQAAQAEETQRIFNEFGRAVENSINRAADAVAAGSFNMSTWLKSLALDLARVGLTNLVEVGGKALVDNLFATPGVDPSYNGNVFRSGNIVPFANGGVVSSPTMFPLANGRTGLMAERGEEAIMPLRRGPGGRLGVEMYGGGGGGVLEVRLGAGLEASLLNKADARAIRITQSAMSGPQFDARVASASRNASQSRIK